MSFMRDSNGVRLDSAPVIGRGLRARTPRHVLSSHPQETVLATFASGHGWTSGGAWAASNLNDSSDNGWANQVLSGTTPAVSNSGCTFQITGLTAFDVTSKLFKVLVKASAPTNLSAVQLYVSDSSAFTNNALLVAVPGLGPTLLPNQWTVMTFSLDQATVTATPPAYTAITALKLRVADVGSATTIKFGGLSMMPRSTAYPNGVVSITLDDSYASHYTYARQILNRYRFKPTLFPIIGTLDTPGRLTSVQLDELARLHGWEVGGHASSLASHTAGLPGLSAAALAAELDAVKGWLVDRNYNGADLFAYPLGTYDSASVAAVEQRFAAARTTDGSLKETPFPGAPSRLRCLSLTSSSTAASVQTAIDQAYTHGLHLILLMHDVVASGATGNQFGSLSTIVDYLFTKGIPVRPLGVALTAA